jgi:hypothetical protein
MRKTAALIAFAMTAGLSGPSLASDDTSREGDAKGRALGEAAIKAKLSEGGYSVRKVQPGIGHYDVKATDNSGAKVDLDVNPRTGEIMKPVESGDKP